MRILVNGRTLVGQKTGIGHYTNELVRCLGSLVPTDSLKVFCPGWFRKAAQWASPSKDSVPSHKTKVTLKGRLVSWAKQCERALFRWQLGRSLRSDGVTVYHEPNFLPVDCDVPTVVSVHDLSVMLRPEWHPVDRVAHHQREFLNCIARADHILAISDFARAEIIRTLGVPADRVTRTYMGTRPGMRPLREEEIVQKRQQLNLPERFLLYLGTIEPRKNLMTLLRAYCGLPVQTRLRYPLLLVGSVGWNSHDVLSFLEDEGRHRGVHRLGYVPDESLPILYNAARALVFPSRYEGFGLPPVEMMACGGAVIAAPAGAVAETVGRKACLVDPDDVEGWRESILRVCEEDDYWLELRRDVTDVVRRFTWERCAEDTLSVYRLLAGERPRLRLAA
jgi:alpha-1,3-rhamnosyl/mannosyltransferase